jgi:hypothetical protein
VPLTLGGIVAGTARRCCDINTSSRARRRSQLVSSPGGAASRSVLEIASESPAAWPRAA